MGVVYFPILGALGHMTSNELQPLSSGMLA